MQRRKFRRVRFRKSALVQMRDKRRTVRGCTLLDVSPGGVGIEVEDASDIRRGDSLTVTLRTGSRRLEIPGKVAHKQGETCGIKLHLELAGASTRQAYARWIVSLVGGLDRVSVRTA